MLNSETVFFLGFTLFIVLMLGIDLGLFAKKDQAVTTSRALLMSIIWVSFALIFFIGLRFFGNYLHNIHTVESLEVGLKTYHEPTGSVLNHGNLAARITSYNHTLSLDFITGYLIEYALSIDNIFVIVLIFKAFAVDTRNYHRVLFWGILGAIFMRGLFIFLGTALITRFSIILYLFGAFLVYTGISLFINRNKEEEIDAVNHPVVKITSRFFPVTNGFKRGKFFTHNKGKLLITPLLLVLLVVEFSDLIFAVDSIPAIFAITKDPYIVFFSNIFAILGLRSLFFLLINIIDRFKFLKVGLSLLLTFIGMKMLAATWLERIGFTNLYSLLIILAIILISVLASLISTRHEEAKTG